MFKTIDSDKYVGILNSLGLSPEEINKEKSTCADGLYGKICPLLGLANNYNNRLALENCLILNKNKLEVNMDVIFDERTVAQTEVIDNDNSNRTSTEFAECSNVALEADRSVGIIPFISAKSELIQDFSEPASSGRRNKVFSKCRNFLARTTLSEETFKVIWNAKVQRSNRREIFLAAIHSLIPCICNVKHFSTIPTKVSCYMYCIHKVCRRYIAELTRDRIINVWMNDVEINHTEERRKRTRAPSKRENMKYRMSLLNDKTSDQSYAMDFGEDDFDNVPVEDYTSANDFTNATNDDFGSTVDEDFTNTTSEDFINTSNEEFTITPSEEFTNVPMLDIIRKITSDANKNPCEVNNFIMDVFEKQRNDRERGGEATIHGFDTFFLATVNQAKIASSAKSNLIIPILNFDVSGSLLQKLGFNFDGKYHHSAMMRWGSKILPIFDIISVSHSEINLRKCLHDVQCFILEHTGRWNIFPTIVVNFCKPSINAILAVTMSTTLNKYLEQLFEYSSGKAATKPEVIVLLCNTQYVKLLIWDVKETVKNKKMQQSYIFALLKIMNSATFEDADSKVISLLNVLLTPYTTVEIKQHQQQILDDDNVPNMDDIMSQIIHGDETIKSDDMVHKEGPFYKRYITIMQDILNSKAKNDGPVNNFYSRPLALKLLNKHLSYLPLWSSFLSPNREPVSNSIIENYFVRIKEQCLSRGTAVENLQIKEFVDMHSTNTKLICERIMSDMQDWNNISKMTN